MDLLRLTQLLVVGLESGVAYAVIGLALVLIFRTARVLNFAQGAMAALSGYVAYSFIMKVGMPWVTGVLAALIVTAVLAAAMERVAIRPLTRQGFMSVVIATLGIEIFVSNATLRIWGAAAAPFPAPITQVFVLGGVRIGGYTLLLLGVVLVVVVIFTWVLQRTELGLAMRAFAEDQTAASLMGIPDGTVSRGTWILSALVGGLAGILFAPVLFLQVGYMSGVFIKGFTAAILGGFTNLPGAFLGGLLLGLLETYTTNFAPPFVSSSLPLLIVLAILMLRPRGLFTRGRVVERV